MCPVNILDMDADIEAAVARIEKNDPVAGLHHLINGLKTLLRFEKEEDVQLGKLLRTLERGGLFGNGISMTLKRAVKPLQEMHALLHQLANLEAQYPGVEQRHERRKEIAQRVHRLFVHLYRVKGHLHSQLDRERLQAETLASYARKLLDDRALQTHVERIRSLARTKGVQNKFYSGDDLLRVVTSLQGSINHSLTLLEVIEKELLQRFTTTETLYLQSLKDFIMLAQSAEQQARAPPSPSLVDLKERLAEEQQFFEATAREREAGLRIIRDAAIRLRECHRVFQQDAVEIEYLLVFLDPRIRNAQTRWTAHK